MSVALSIDPVPFEVIEVREPSRVRLRVCGEFDLATADLVADRLRRLRERGAAVLLDLDELTFIDAAGLRVILTAAEDARNDAWTFAVTRGSAPVRRLFAIVHAETHLTFDGSSS
jgi:anti-sigma B factor antagonist